MTRTRMPLPLSLLSLLAAAAVGFLWWHATPGAGEPLPEAVLPGSGVRAAEPDPFAKRLSAPVLDEVADVGAPAPEGLARIAQPLDEGDLPPLVVQVWRGRPGMPAAGAEVFVAGFEPPRPPDPFAPRWSSLAESRGRRFLADGKGRVELPPVRQPVVVAARLEGAYGFRRVGRNHREVESLVLVPDETLTVRVVDGEGRPVAGVPVGVVQRVPQRELEGLLARMQQLEAEMARVRTLLESDPQRAGPARDRLQQIRRSMAEAKAAAGKAKERAAGKGGKKGRPGPEPAAVTERVELRAQRRTDAAGLAVFGHFQLFRHQPEKWWPEGHRDRFEAVLLLPLLHPQAVAFAGRPVPGGILELRLPATGSVALRPIDAAGRPFSHPVHAVLVAEGGDRPPWARAQRRKGQDEETLVFPFVGLGLTLSAHCRLDDEDFRWQARAFAGPSRAGERVTVDLLVAPGEGMLTGRLLDAAGRPLAGARPSFLISSLAGRLEGEELTLDRDGRFHLPYQVRDRHLPPFDLEIRRNDRRPVQGCRVALPALPRAAVTDLGELRLAPLGLIAEGRVVDDRGQPVAAAAIQLQGLRDVRAGRAQPVLEFVDQAFAAMSSDHQGRYALFGTLGPGRYRLRALAPGHFPVESADLKAGQRLDLQLVRESRLVGTVRAPDWLQRHRVRAHLVPLAGGGMPRQDRIHDHRGRTYVYFDRVLPGTYDLEFRVQDFPDPFLRIERLQVPPGQQEPHPRLAGIDLGAWLHRFEIVAVDENGHRIAPERPLLAEVLRPDGSSAFVGLPWKGGRTEVVHAGAQLRVLPLAAGYRAEPAVLAAGRSELRFLRVPALELQVAGVRQIAPDTRIWILAEPVSSPLLPDSLPSWDPRSERIAGWYRKGRNAVAELDATDRASLTLTGPGRYRATAYLGGRKERVVLGTFEARRIPGSGTERVVLTPDLAAIQAAVARLAAQGDAGGGR